MTIDPSEAAATLSEVETVERRTREALYYGGSSTILIVWGLMLMIGHVLTFLAPMRADLIWGVLNGSAIACAVAFGSVRARTAPRSWDWRMVVAVIVMMGFGYLWEWLLVRPHWRELPVLWSTLFMMGYIIAGLWLGRFFIICGVVVTALVLAGYVWTGPWFLLWMAAVSGGSLILGGLMLRRLGAP
jgi:hypothetical protein